MKRAIGQSTSQRPGSIRWDQACHAAQTAGFDGLEVVLDDSREDLRESGDQQSDKQVTIASAGRVTLLAASVRCGTTDHQTAVAWLSNHLRRASALGVRTLNLALPGVARPKETARFDRYQEALNFAHGLARSVRFEAESHGVAVALEAACDGFLLSPVELRELVDLANSHAVGVCLDLPRIARIGDPIDWIVTLNRRIACLRIRHPKAMNDGSSPLLDVRRALDECGYTGPVIVDGDRVPELFRQHKNR